MDIEALKQRIQARHGSVHAFCRAAPALKRATVYQVLSGRYPGNTARQLARIHAALEGLPEPAPARAIMAAADMAAVLQNCKCGHCRRLDKRGCHECRTQTQREAQALAAHMATGQGGAYV